MKQILIIIPYLPNIEALLNKSLILEGSDRPSHSALKVSEYRTPQNPRTFRSSSQNSLSGQLKIILKLLPCHAMASLQHDGKNDTVKTEKSMQCFFSPSNVPKISKIKFWFFYDCFLVIDPNYDAKISNFPYPKF